MGNSMKEKEIKKIVLKVKSDVDDFVSLKEACAILGCQKDKFLTKIVPSLETNDIIETKTNTNAVKKLYKKSSIINVSVQQQQEQTVLKNQQKADKIVNNYSDNEITLAFGKNLENKNPEEILKMSLQLMGVSLNKMKEANEKEIKILQQENSNLKVKLGLNQDYYSVKRVSMINNKSQKDYNWRLLKNKSFELGLEIKDEQDSNYGTVKSYHINVWKACYPNEKY